MDLTTVVTVALAAAGAALAVVLIKRAGGGTTVAQEIREDLRNGLREGREESGRSASELRSELASQMQRLTDSNREAIDRLREGLSVGVKELQASNEQKLDEMRRTVDEKLENTLQKRLNASFNLVSERLDAVNRGLGEMQDLSAGVGDLNRMLTNVKKRGTFGEVRLGALLEQVLTPAQYDTNVKTKAGSNDKVEYAVKMPVPEDGGHIWLPIDAKFPMEDYRRLLEAEDAADADAVEAARKALVAAVKKAARDVSDKYLDPPRTTDVAVLFLPTESLYAEVVREPGTIEDLYSNEHVLVAGPSTMLAQLDSWRVGIKALAINQRSGEVRKILAGVKTEFGNFGAVLEKLQKQLNTASKTLEATGVRTRAIERKLRDVEELPEAEAQALLGTGDGAIEVDAESDAD